MLKLKSLKTKRLKTDFQRYFRKPQKEKIDSRA